VIVVIEAEGGAAAPAPAPAAAPKQAAEKPSDAPLHRAGSGGTVRARAGSGDSGRRGRRHASHASPSVRKFARELGVDVSRVQGTGPKGRITQDDVTAFIKGVMTGQRAAPAAAAAPAGGGELNLLPWPKVDFTKFGPVDPKPLSRIKKISGANLHRNWVMIPHVTNNDEADITELEALRVQLNKENEKAGVKFTMLAFVIKAVVSALEEVPDVQCQPRRRQPRVQAVLQRRFCGRYAERADGAGDSRRGQEGLVDIAKEMAELSKARVTASSSRIRCRAAASRSLRLGGLAGRTSRRSSMRLKSPFSVSVA
jgi:pyruvate dehydrogenase E2 component (dihydrolipoamide acetyltransferase)